MFALSMSTGADMLMASTVVLGTLRRSEEQRLHLRPRGHLAGVDGYAGHATPFTNPTTLVSGIVQLHAKRELPAGART